MADENKQATEATGQTAQEQQASELTINDLNALKAIIDLASQRGAFKPNEMMAVGQTYTKLAAFLDNVAKQAEAQQKAAQQGA